MKKYFLLFSTLAFSGALFAAPATTPTPSATPSGSPVYKAYCYCRMRNLNGTLDGILRPVKGADTGGEAMLRVGYQEIKECNEIDGRSVNPRDPKEKRTYQCCVDSPKSKSPKKDKTGFVCD